MKVLQELIEKQRKGKDDSPVWMVGEQLLDIAEREPSAIDILKRDLEIPEMSIVEAEKKINEWADKHKKGSCCCVSPKVAEGILREFYGLASPTEEKAAASAPDAEQNEFIDLDNFF
jgi:hypothetical protein